MIGLKTLICMWSGRGIFREGGQKIIINIMRANAMEDFVVSAGCFRCMISFKHFNGRLTGPHHHSLSVNESGGSEGLNVSLRTVELLRC